MTKIFISHSDKDSIFAVQLAQALIGKGIDVWIDKSDIRAGQIWWDEIQRGLDECDKMILILSPDAMASRNVADEWGYYLDEKKQIFTVRWIPVKTHFRLRGIQYVDFHQLEFAGAFEKLTLELGRNGIVVSDVPGEIHEIRSDEAAAGGTPSAAGAVAAAKGDSSLSKRLLEGFDYSRVDFSENKVLSGMLKGVPRLENILPPPFEWCEIPAGKVTLEAGGSLKGRTTFDVAAFRIAKYPITNAQYQMFVDERKGYRYSPWWDYSVEAMDWRLDNPSPHEPGFAGDDLPRMNITWYEAVAFCRWLSAKNSTLFEITLPTEPQWQRAAQGDDGRAFPWGNTFDSGKANTSESKIGLTTPVTGYPEGTSPYGVMDMSGNVWEWCMTMFESGENTLAGIEGRVVRGGSWRSNQGLARVNYRNFYTDRIRHFVSATGFRVCVS
ncbi:MAG: SUMF1/EgtB/PvdO family nonheme iron enzyme [Chloroflexi bacterium]|nr:SUMF1/EgtB/PvdO family nonheme iron enzyme [Chloroflexota bacterium]